MTTLQEYRTIFRVWLVWDFEKEELWLNEMAARGWVLDRVWFCTFRFVRMEPNDYSIHMELRGVDDGYEDFLQELGMERIGRVAGWVYHRQRASVGGEKHAKNIDQRIAHMGRISKLLGVIGAANLCLGVVNSFNASYMGTVNLLCGCLLMYALGRIHGKQDELRKERLLHE